ncbi:glycosyltransferase [Guptibacillus algicola]|uniref:glycosyltransferase n=1 Tax=Guptibacillus algicola TaxID=225844 RepID=UPI001CD3F091|nr:glycosyltransferase [Alkalihalobacillus algicola]MCA0987857.1 glycosyltransferase [Alkalihalobacillus algicola]
MRRGLKTLNDSPKVSIIIPFYNCAYVNQAIESALNQTYKNIETIVVDDGSSMHKELIAPYFPFIKYVYKNNGGTATALNRGIGLATGELIAWLSSDDLFFPEKIAKQVSYMKRTSADLVYTNYSLIDGNNVVFRESVGTRLRTRLAFLKHIQNSCPINGSTVMVKKEMFRKSGPFNPKLKYTQDYDMWIRMARHARIKSMDEALLYYRKHEKMGSALFSDEQLIEIDALKKRYKNELDKLILKEQNRSIIDQ